MRFHVVSLPHTNTTEDFTACAYTEKVRKFCIMMKDLGADAVGKSLEELIDVVPIAKSGDKA